MPILLFNCVVFPPLPAGPCRGLRPRDHGAPDAAHRVEHGQRLCGQRQVQRGQDAPQDRTQTQQHGHEHSGRKKTNKIKLYNIFITC